MNKQKGMTLTSFLAVLAVAGFAIFIGMKLFPMYQEFYAVKAAMKGVASEPNVGNMPPAQIQTALFRRLDISYSESVKRDNVKFERINGGWNMRVTYEVRRPLIGNLDVVGNFDASQELNRSSGQ